MYSEEINDNSVGSLQVENPVPIISGLRSTDKKFVPSDNSQQLAEQEILMKRNLIITRNKLIGRLLKTFSFQIRKNKKEVQQTEQKLSSLIDGVLSEDPDNIYTICYAIRFAKLKGDVPETIRLLQRKLEITPDDSVALKELEALQKAPRVPEISQSDKHSFLSQYNRLKKLGNLEDLETLLRARLSVFPEDSLLENQLAGVLLDRIELNPDESSELIDESRQILYRLREMHPNNLRVTSNLIRLEKLTANEQAFENHVRLLISQDPSNYKAKTQLVQILLSKAKVQGVHKAKEQGIVQEINSLLEQVLSEFPTNSTAIGQSIQFARFLGDLKHEEALLRRAIELEPTNPILKSQLTGVLLTKCPKGTPRKEKVVRFLEAEQLALERFENDPRNLHTITYLIRIAHLQGNIHDEKKWLELKLSIDPKDINAKKDLERINRRFGTKPSAPPTIPPPAGEPRVPEVYKPSPSLLSYKDALMDSIKTNNNQSTLNILNEMLKDASIDDASKKKIRVMIDLARSNKPRSQITLRTKIQDFR